MKDGSGDLIVNMLKQVECMVVDSPVSVKVDVLDSQSEQETLSHSQMIHLNKGFVDSIFHKEQSHNCKHQPSLNNDSVLSESLVPCKEVSQCLVSLSLSCFVLLIMC